MNSLSANNYLPRQDVTINHMKSRLEDLSKAFTLPVKCDGTDGEELFAVETRADGLFLAYNLIGHTELIDHFPCNEIVSFTASIKSHLERHI